MEIQRVMTDAGAAWDGILRLTSWTDTAIRDALRPEHLTIRQFELLEYIAQGPVGNDALLSTTGYDPSTLTRMLDRLEGRKLVRRRKDPGQDHRRRQVRATEEGKLVVERFRTAMLSAVDHLLAGTSKKGRLRFFRGVREIAERISGFRFEGIPGLNRHWRYPNLHEVEPASVDPYSQ